MKKRNRITNYSAQYEYQGPTSIGKYESDRFSGLLGKYRWKREQKAIASILEELPNKELTICDCPCGTGRWWHLLSKHASKIIAVDNSEAMLKYASNQAGTETTDIELQLGKAEKLALPDNSVDYVFSHALTKHLPIPIQYEVLKEFSRVSKFGVICSFGLFTHMTYEFWRRRKLEESYPVFYEELEWMATAANLKIITKIPCTTPIGTENTIFFRKNEND